MTKNGQNGVILVTWALPHTWALPGALGGGGGLPPETGMGDLNVIKRHNHLRSPILRANGNAFSRRIGARAELRAERAHAIRHDTVSEVYDSFPLHSPICGCAVDPGGRTWSSIPLSDTVRVGLSNGLEGNGAAHRSAPSRQPRKGPTLHAHA